MTKNIMTQLAKKANVSIENFDSVQSWLNENECDYFTNGIEWKFNIN